MIGSAPGRQTLTRFGEAFIHLLAGKVDIHVVAEDRGHLRKTVAGDGASVFQAWHARQSRLDRKGDLLLDLHRRQCRRFGVDLHLLVGDVRHGINGQALQGIPAQTSRRGGQEHHQQAVLNGKADDAFEHEGSPFSTAGVRVPVP